MTRKLISIFALSLLLAFTLVSVIPAHANAATLLTYSQGDKIANTAEKYVGRSGISNVGFVKYVLGKYDINVSNDLDKLAGTGKRVYNLQPGDIVFFDNYSHTDLAAVGIYVGSGKFVGANSYSGRVVRDYLYRYRYVGARRMYQPETGTNDNGNSAPSTPNTNPDDSTDSSTPVSQYGSKIVNEAEKYVGKPYVFGASTASTSSFDCSSFVQRAVRDAELGKLPRTARSQAAYMAQNGQSVTRAKLQPGDILFWKNMGSHVPAGTVSHVGIYYGNNKIIQALPGKGVVITKMSSYYTDPSRVYGAYRLMNPIK